MELGGIYMVVRVILIQGTKITRDMVHLWILLVREA